MGPKRMGRFGAAAAPGAERTPPTVVRYVHVPASDRLPVESSRDVPVCVDDRAHQAGGWLCRGGSESNRGVGDGFSGGGSMVASECSRAAAAWTDVRIPRRGMRGGA